MRERDELVGRFRVVSRFPQYLPSRQRSAIEPSSKGSELAYLLDHGDVNWCRSTGPVDLRVARFGHYNYRDRVFSA